MKINQAHLNGAKQIIGRCLGLQKEQNLLIIADETTYKLSTVLSNAALSLGVSAVIIFIPVEQQKQIPKQNELSNLIQNAAREARGIITCVNSSPEGLPFRDRILEHHWNARTRIGHMPGASFSILKLANVDFDQLVKNCHSIELAMARGKDLQLVSVSGDGQEHLLRVSIGGWNRIPVASNGVISDGIWGNVPSGETYIAPIEESAEGTVVINGSIPGMVVGKKLEFFLEFRNGHVVDIYPKTNLAVKWLVETQIDVAKRQGDLNWSNLAEIGIGVNHAVHRLSGNMLFDEKCAGTAHVALGGNNYMGGIVKSVIHCDMVVKRPTILIDGKQVMDLGKLVVNDLEWTDNHQLVDLSTSMLNTANKVCRSGGQVEIAENRLNRLLHSEPGRVTRYPIGDAETSKHAAKLFGLIPANNGWITLSELIDHMDLDEKTLKQLLHIMSFFEIIKYEE